MILVDRYAQMNLGGEIGIVQGADVCVQRLLKMEREGEGDIHMQMHLKGFE